MELNEIVTKGGGVMLLFMTLVQLAPIKLNPWTWVAKAVGRAINGEVIEKVNALSKDLNEFKAVCDKREAEQRRMQILRFGDEILHGVQHSKEHFDQILLDCTYYEQFCDDHPYFANGVAVQTIALIKSTYMSCMEEKTFL